MVSYFHLSFILSGIVSVPPLFVSWGVCSIHCSELDPINHNPAWLCVWFFTTLSVVCDSLVAVVRKNRPRNMNLALCLRHHLTETGSGNIGYGLNHSQGVVGCLCLCVTAAQQWQDVQSYRDRVIYGKNTRAWVRKHTNTYSLSQWKSRWFGADWQQHLHDHVTTKPFSFSALYVFLSLTPIKQVRKHLHKLSRSLKVQHI